MARNRLLAASAAALLVLTLTACSGQTGTPAAAPPTSQTVATTPSSSATAQITTPTSKPSTTTVRPSTVTVTAIPSDPQTSAASDVPYDATIVVGSKYYYCDDVYATSSSATYCTPLEQAIWDQVAYYRPSGFESFIAAGVKDGLLEGTAQVTSGLALGLLACEAYATATGSDPVSAGRLAFQATLSEHDETQVGTIYDYSQYYICGA